MENQSSSVVQGLDADTKKSEKDSRDSLEKRVKLRSLEDKKDALVMQLRSGQISIDQYNAAIGNIPTQIKKLKTDLEKEQSPPEQDLSSDLDQEQEAI